MGIGIVTTKFGKVIGEEIQEGRYSGITSFRSVPYASPPIGNLRWRPPVDPEHWDGVRDCSEFASRCPQPLIAAINFEPYQSDFYYTERPEMSEDCLYLCITTGAQSNEERRPVFMWFHGGGLSYGEYSEREFDPNELARKGIVVISVAQRLNIFGYLTLPQLSEEQGGHSGNYGLMDQIKALDWVYENIAAFGGDPDNITIGGQSGGTIKTGALACSPAQKGRVRRVINQSMLCWLQVLPSMETEAEKAKLYLESIGIDPSLSTAELRALPWTDLLRKSIIVGKQSLPKVPGSMVCDGDLVPYNRMAESLKLYAKNCDFLSGINYGEVNMAGSILSAPRDDSKGGLYADAKFLLGELYEKYEFEKLVPLEGENEDHVSRRLAAEGLTPNLGFRGVIVDRCFGMYRSEIHPESKNYCYLFSHLTPDRPEDKETPRDNDKTLAWHSSELWYTFASLREGVPPCRPWTEVDYRLADQLSSYWANFIRTGDPNGEGLPVWPSSGNNYGWMELGDVPEGHQGIHDGIEAMIYEYVKENFKIPG